jgi:hypothetical protein
MPPYRSIRRNSLFVALPFAIYGTQFEINKLQIENTNYKKPFELITRNTLGSYGLYTNFTSLSGKPTGILVTTLSLIIKGKWV